MSTESDNEQEAVSTPLRINALEGVPAISALGVVAARMLQQQLIVTLMVARDGSIQVVPDGELQLDSCNEEDALATLVQKGYTDAQLYQYLEQRSVRLARKDSEDGGNL
jgi:hypothetical protein